MYAHPIGEKVIFTKDCEEFSRNEMVEIIDNKNGLYVLQRKDGSIEKFHQKDVHNMTVRYRILCGKNKLIYDMVGVLPDDYKQGEI